MSHCAYPGLLDRRVSGTGEGNVEGQIVEGFVVGWCSNETGEDLLAVIDTYSPGTAVLYIYASTVAIAAVPRLPPPPARGTPLA